MLQLVVVLIEVITSNITEQPALWHLNKTKHYFVSS